ncbi:MAG: hypothetical protein O3B87_05930 [bacterium]|nr:hypothetical protein [bacterium]
MEQEPGSNISSLIHNRIILVASLFFYVGNFYELVVGIMEERSFGLLAAGMVGMIAAGASSVIVGSELLDRNK